MKILFIEDEKNIANPVIRIMQKQGYTVDYAEDGEIAMNLLNIYSYDCVVLDLNIPKIDGLNIAKHIRDNIKNTPILMLTARSQLYDKLEGFESGADDYLTKPFELQELLARVKALIKRASVCNDFVLTIGPLNLDPSLNILENKDLKIEISLRNKESLILEYLIRNKGKVISTEELLEHVWDSNFNEFSGTVKTHMKTLRDKMGEYGKLIQTIKGKGYIVKV
ncbi:MAG: response regulator transcription factor [bacterium]